MAAGAFVCTCSWTCLEVSCSRCPSVWLCIAISIWRFHNPTTTPGATTRNSNKTLIDNIAWSACIFSSYLLSSLDFTVNLVTSIALHLHLVKHSHPCVTTQFCSCWSWDSSNAWACKGLHLIWQQLTWGCILKDILVLRHVPIDSVQVYKLTQLVLVVTTPTAHVKAGKYPFAKSDTNTVEKT